MKSFFAYLILLLISTTVDACDVFSAYNSDEKKIDIYVSGDPTYCQVIEKIKEKYGISEKQAIGACKKLKKQKKIENS